MTSTNDGKDVKSNQTSGPKGKSYYIELYKSLDGRLSGECDLRSRTEHLCAAWRRVHSLCQHSAPATHPHLVSWLQRHTARTILQTEWQSSNNKDDQARLEGAINAFIEDSQAAIASRDGFSPPWESQLQQRGEWFKKILPNPWGHPVLRVLTDPRGQTPSDAEVLEWLKEERGVMFVTRLRQLASSRKCVDLALGLVTAVMDRVRATTKLVPDQEQLDETKEKPKPSNLEATFANVLTTEAGFTVDVWELLTDIEFVLLHKLDRRSKCIELAKQTPLRNGFQLVERLQSRLETSPREKKLWKNAKEVATLTAQVLIARCMVIPTCSGVARTALYCCTRSLARLVPGAGLPAAAAALAAPAATARHLHTLAAAVHAQVGSEMKPFVCELYVRAITAGMNELERLKLKTEKESEARLAEQTLSSWFTQLGGVLGDSERINCECTLTAFSAHPSAAMYDRIQAAPALKPVALDPQEVKEETTSEFGSWATDSRTQTNLVKTSETLNMKQNQNQANVLSIAILNEGEALGLSPELCQDLTVLLSGPRLKTLSWDMDRELLLENCRVHMERTHSGTRALTTELKYLNLDPSSYQHLPEEDDEETDAFYGIEKGYEHLVEHQEEIWDDVLFDDEKTESANSSSVESDIITVRRKKKGKKPLLSSDDDDPLSQLRVEKKKERPHSKERKERKKKAKSQDSESKDRSRERRKEESSKKEKKKDPLDPEKKKEKKPRKKKSKEPKEKVESKPGGLSRLIGLKVAKIKIPDGIDVRCTATKAFIPCVTDSDYDSQGKSSLASLNSEGNDPDVLFDGLFSMDDYKSPERQDPLSDRNTLSYSELSVSNGQVAVNVTRTPNKQGIDRLTSHFSKNIIQSPRPVPPLGNIYSAIKQDQSTSKNVNHVREEVKNSITKLLEFRRQKALFDQARNIMSSPTPSQSSNSDTAAPVYRSPIARPQFPDQQIISPKSVEVPDIPKVFISKTQVEQIQTIKNKVDDYLNKRSTKSAIESANKQHVPKALPLTYNDFIKSNNQQEKSSIHSMPQTSHVHETGRKSKKSKHVQKSLQSKFLDTPGQKSFKDFLRELQESINAGTGANKGVNSSSNQIMPVKKEVMPLKKEVKPASRVTPITPKNKADPASQCAKTVTHGKSVENQLNTFSRLSYMHKNKHMAESVISRQDQTFARCIEDHKTAKLKYLQTKSDIVVSRLGNTPNKMTSGDNNTHIVVRKIEKTPSVTIKEHPVLSNILMSPKQSLNTKLTHPRTDNLMRNVSNCSEKSRTSISTSIVKNSSLSERDQNDLVLLLRQQNKLNTQPSPNLDPLNVSTIVNNPQYTLQSKTNLNNSLTSSDRTVIKSSHTVQSNTGSNSKQNYEGYRIQNVDFMQKQCSSNTVECKTSKVNKTHTKITSPSSTNIQNIKEVNAKIGQNEPADSNTNSDKKLEPQDWEEVMNAILSHKTPSRGPNALNMALKKETYSDSKLRHHRIVRTSNTKDLNKSNTAELGKQYTQYPAKIMEADVGNKHTQISSTKTVFTNVVKQHTQVPSSKTSMSVPNSEILVVKPVTSTSSSTVSLANTNATKTISFDTTKQKSIQILQNDVVKKPTAHSDQKKQFANEFLKEKDPFISGIPNSDYDLLEELMDDELRKEIGELSSDDDTYKALEVNKGVKITNAKCSNLIKTRFSQLNKEQAVDLRCETIVRKHNRDSIIQPNNAVKPVKNQNIRKPETPWTQTANEGNLVNTCQNDDNNTVTKLLESNQQVCSTHVIHRPATHILSSNKNNEQQTHTIQSNINVVDPRNVVITVPQPAVQNVVLIGSELVYDTFTPIQTQLHTGIVGQPPYVAFNSSPNIAVFQTTQFTAPVVNPLIIGNAMTMPATKTVAAANASPPFELPQDYMSKQKELNNTSQLSEECPPLCMLSSKHNAVKSKAVLDTSPKEFVKPQSPETTNHNVPTGVTVNVSLSESKTPCANSNMKCEKKVLSQIQEKCNVHEIEKQEAEKPQSRPFTHNSIKNEHTKLVEEKMIQPKHDLELSRENKLKDLERLKIKRLAIINRQMHHTSGKTPIPLSYSPLKREYPTSVVNNHKVKLKVCNQEQEDKTNILNKNIEKKLDNAEIYEHTKENNSNASQIPRVVLRSANDLKLKIVTSVIDKPQNKVSRKTKVRLKGIAEAVSKLPKGTKIMKIKPVKRMVEGNKVMEIKSQNPSEAESAVQLDLNDETAKEESPRRVSKRILKSKSDKVVKDNISIVTLQDNAFTAASKDNAVTVTLEDNAVTVTSKDNAVTAASKNNAVIAASNEKPAVVATNDKSITTTPKDGSLPIVVLKDNAVTVAPDDSIVVSKQSSKIENQRNSSLINTSDLIDIEDELQGSKIPKIKYQNAKGDSKKILLKHKISIIEKDAEMKSPTETTLVPADKKVDKKNNSKKKNVPDNDNINSTTGETVINKINRKDHSLKTGCNNQSKNVGKTCESLLKKDTSKKADQPIEKIIKTDKSNTKSEQTAPVKNVVAEAICSNKVLKKRIDPDVVNPTDEIDKEVINANKKLETQVSNDIVPGITKFLPKSHPLVIENLLPVQPPTPVLNYPKKTNTSHQIDNSPGVLATSKDIAKSQFQLLKEKIVIEELPTHDSTKKCVRVKLPNGKVFKATVYGKMHVSIESLFSDMSLKSMLLNSVNDSKRYTLNIKQVSTSDKEDPSKIIDTRIEEINLQAKEQLKTIETVNLLSDDEDEPVIPVFKTPFGNYKIPLLGEKDFKIHKQRFEQKCIVNIEELPFFSNEQQKSVAKSDDLNDVISETPNKEEVPVSTNQGVTGPEVIEIDDSSNDSVDIISESISQQVLDNVNVEFLKSIAPQVNNKPDEKIIEFKSLLLKDLGVDLTESLENTQTAPVVTLANAASDKPLIKTKDCFVKISRCDDLIKNIKKSNGKCTVDLVRCDEIESDVSNNEHNVEKITALNNCNEFINVDEEVASICETASQRSRSGSLSLLNDFPFYTEVILNVPPEKSYDYERSSPVIDVFDTIAAFKNYSSTTKRVSEYKHFDIIETLSVACCTGWFKTKRQISMESKEYLSDLKPNSLEYQSSYLSTEVPMLKTLTAMLFQDYSLLEKIVPHYSIVKHNIKLSTSHNLKRKLRNVENQNTTSKIFKSVDNCLEIPKSSSVKNSNIEMRIGEIVEDVNNANNKQFDNSLCKSIQLASVCQFDHVDESNTTNFDSLVPNKNENTEKHVQCESYKGKHEIKERDNLNTGTIELNEYIKYNAYQDLTNNSVLKTVSLDTDTTEDNKLCRSDEIKETILNTDLRNDIKDSNILGNKESINNKQDIVADQKELMNDLKVNQTDKTNELIREIQNLVTSESKKSMQERNIDDQCLKICELQKFLETKLNKGIIDYEESSESVSEKNIKGSEKSCKTDSVINTEGKQNLPKSYLVIDTLENEICYKNNHHNNTIKVSMLDEPSYDYPNQSQGDGSSKENNVLSVSLELDCDVKTKISTVDIKEDKSLEVLVSGLFKSTKSITDHGNESLKKQENIDPTQDHLIISKGTFKIELEEPHKETIESILNDELKPAQSSFNRESHNDPDFSPNKKSNINSDENVSNHQLETSQLSSIEYSEESNNNPDDIIIEKANDHLVAITSSIAGENSYAEQETLIVRGTIQYKVLEDVDNEHNLHNQNPANNKLHNIQTINSKCFENLLHTINETNTGNKKEFISCDCDISPKFKKSITNTNVSSLKDICGRHLSMLKITSNSTIDLLDRKQNVKQTDDNLNVTNFNKEETLLSMTNVVKNTVTDETCNITESCVTQQDNTLEPCNNIDAVERPAHMSKIEKNVMKTDISSTTDLEIRQYSCEGSLNTDLVCSVIKKTNENYNSSQENQTSIKDVSDDINTNNNVCNSPKIDKDAQTNRQILPEKSILSDTDSTSNQSVKGIIESLDCAKENKTLEEVLGNDGGKIFSDDFDVKSEVEQIKTNKVNVKDTNVRIKCSVSTDSVHETTLNENNKEFLSNIEPLNKSPVKILANNKTDYITNKLVSTQIHGHGTNFVEKVIKFNTDFLEHDNITKEDTLHDPSYKTVDHPVSSDKSEVNGDSSTQQEFVKLKGNDFQNIKMLDHEYALTSKLDNLGNENESNGNGDAESRSSPAFTLSDTIPDESLENILDAFDENSATSLRKEVTLVYKDGTDLVLKGIEYEDPVVGTCYVFPLAESPTLCSEIEDDQLHDSSEEIIQVTQELNDDGTVDNIVVETRDVHDIYDDFFSCEVKIPKFTYSKICNKPDIIFNHSRSTKMLKRKSDMSDIRVSEKRYRKGKNIDYPKITVSTMIDSAYGKEYKRVLDYCSTLKFSYSQPFHKELVDVDDVMKDWPIKGSCNSDIQHGGENEHILFFDVQLEKDKYIEFNPIEISLVDELKAKYSESEPSDTINETNFNMGFGEGSDRVIQNLEGVDVSKFSAATLSDVKQPQPFLLSEDYEDDKDDKKDEARDDQIKKLEKHVTYIQMRDKVRSFFKRNTVELCYELMKQNGKCNTMKQLQIDASNFPFDIYISNFIEPCPVEAVVQVVQVGQLPVSAAAQNPVTCDPRVTQVSDASPSQCSVENSPQDDSQVTIKTEYTELTTADFSLPLQDYAHHNQTLPMESQEPNAPITNENIDTEIKSVVKIEMEEMPEIKEEIVETLESCKIENSSPLQEEENNLDYSFATNDTNNINNTSEFQSIFNTPEKQNLEESHQQQQQKQQKQQNGTPEKTDQIAHAMNAAGITTTAETIANNTTRAHAFVNILSQKLRQGSINATQAASTNFAKTTSINALSLQQALAQILPPPLNQTNMTENNQHTSNVPPQVLHIVQGKNANGSQITLVDNSQQSVINTPNATPVLHIVQNKTGTTNSTSNGAATPQANSFSGLSLVDAGLQQGGNQLLHIVNTGSQKNNSATGQLLKRVNLLTNLTNVQGSNEQKMVQFVCKSADGKSIQLNAPHQRSMVLRLQPIESTNVQPTQQKPVENHDLSPNQNTNNSGKDNSSQQEIKSRSVYEENYAKFIQSSSSKTTVTEKSTSLPKFNQAFGKSVYQDGIQKQNEMTNNGSHLSSTNTDNNECQSSDNALNLEHIAQISSPPLLLRKQPTQTSQTQSNLVQQIKQTIAPMNIQTMHGGVIYTRQIPVNIGGGQTINLITVPSTELMEDSQKQSAQNQNEGEPSIIKIVPQNHNNSNTEISAEDSGPSIGGPSDNNPHPQPQPVLTQMRIKLPMLSKAPQMVSGTRVVRPSFFQIQRNVIGGTNQPVYQQLVLTAAPPLGQQTIRLPQAQVNRQIKVPTENQATAESQMSSSTLEQLREFDMVLEQVKERSTVQPNSSTSSFSKLHTHSTDTTDGTSTASSTSTESTQQVLYSIGNNQPLNVSYVNRKAAVTTPITSTFVRSPDSSGIIDSPTSSSHVQIPHTVTSETSQNGVPTQPKPVKVSSKSKSRPKTTTHPPSSLKINTVPPKTSTQKPLEDEQTTQRILYILAEYKEQVENSPDKDKPAPRRRSNPPLTPGSGSSKRKKCSSGSRRSGMRDMSPIHGEDTCRTMGSEDSSCGTSQGDCNESCLESHSPQDSPRKVARKISFEPETPPPQPRPLPHRNLIVADGQTITVARGTAGKPATAVLMPANYILPVSMVKGGQQIAIVTNRGPKLLTVGGEGGTTNALLLQRLIGPAGLKPVLARPGVRHVRLPPAALHNLHAFNLATTTTFQPPDSTASPAPAPTPPELVDTRATSSPWANRDLQDVKPERASSPEGSEPWHLPSSGYPHDYSYEETVRTDMDRTVLDPIPDRYSPDMEAQRIFDKMFDVESKKSYLGDSHDDSPRCAYDIDASDCDDKAYHQVVQKKDGHRQHRLTHVSAAALRHKYAILEHELRLQKSLSEECEDLGVDSPSASDLFPEAELLFAASPAHDQTQDQSHHSHTPQPTLMNSSIPQPDIDDQIATDQLLSRNDKYDEQQDLNLGLEDVGIVTVSDDGMQATIALDQEEFARSHPNTTFHSEPTDEGEVQPFTITGLKARHITSTIFHSNRAPATVLMTAPQTTVISQATADNSVKYSDIDNMINSLPTANNNINLTSVLVKDDGLTRFDSILNDSRELHLSNTASAIVHSAGNATQVIRRVCYDGDKRDRFLLDEPEALIAGNDAKMIAEDTLESIPGDVNDDRSSPERHAELFWESNSASEKSEGRRPLDFSSDSEKCCKSPSYEETNSTDSSGVGTHMRLDSVIKEARGVERSGSGSSADDTHPPLRTYPPKRSYHPIDGEMERSLSGKTRAGERSPDSLEVRRRASGRGVVKRGCHCCNGSPAPLRPKKSRQRKPNMDFTTN